MTLWFELKASRIISVPTRTCHLSSETLESPVLPHPPDRRTRTHARIHKCNFSITFFSSLGPPTSLPAPIDPDRPQTKGGSADSYSQRFIQGARRGSPTAAPPPPPQTRDGGFLEEKFNLFPPGTRKLCAVSERTAGIRPHFSPCEGPVKIRGTF